jgi:hypothetical protein
MFKRFATAAVGVLVGGIAFSSIAFAADESDTATSEVGGTIPELCQIVVGGAGTAALLTLAQDGSGELAYDAGFVESDADAIILTIDANKNWQLGAKRNTWTCPGAYDKDEDDLLIQITNAPTGTIQNSFDSYHTLTEVNEVMLDHATGVSDNTVDIQVKVLLDWTLDIPGVYSITITWTMETVTP